MRAGNREFVARRNVYKQLAGYDGSWASKPEGEPLAGGQGKAPEGVNRWPARSANRLGVNRWPEGEPLAGPIGNRLGEPLAGGQGKAPEGEPLAGPIGEPPGRQSLAGGRTVGRPDRQPPGRTAGRPDRQSAGGRTVGRPDRRTAWGVNRWPEGEPPVASTAKRKQKGRHYRPDQLDAYIRPS